MPDEEASLDEKKYHERLNIPVLTIGRIKELIKKNIIDTINAWEAGVYVDRQCFRIIGPAGVGKTDICKQLQGELSAETGKDFSFMMIKAPVLSRDDFIIPFPVTAGGDASFKMLYSDFVPKKDDQSYGLFVIDEFSRGDHALQQLLWQAQNEYAIHLNSFPKGWFVITADNPDDSEYQMDVMEDAAGIRRQLHLYTDVSPQDFLTYAIKSDYHKLIIEFIQTHPEYLYDFESQKYGMVFANPASYEKLSDHLKKIELSEGGIRGNMDDVEYIAAGLLNVNMARMFMEFVTDQKDVNPKDIFYDWRKVKKQVETYVGEGNQSKMGQLMISFCTFMTTSMPIFEAHHLVNIEGFLLTMPIDTAALFISQVDSFRRESDEFKYMTKIHTALLKTSPKYKKEFYMAVVKIGRSD